MTSCYQTLTETAPMTEAHKVILKPEIPKMSWVMLKNHSMEEGSAQKYFIIKWKGFVQEHVSMGMLVIHCFAVR